MDFSLTRNITICRISFVWIFADQLPEVETRPVQGQVSGARTVTKPHLSFLPYSYPHEIFMTVLEFFILNWTDIRCVNSNWMRWWSFRFASYFFFAPYFSIQFTSANWQDVGYKISAAKPLNKKNCGWLPSNYACCMCNMLSACGGSGDHQLHGREEGACCSEKLFLDVRTDRSDLQPTPTHTL